MNREPARSHKAPAPRTLLLRAARVIAGVAEEIRRSETVWLGGNKESWNLADALAKREHDELRGLATELRRYARTLPAHRSPLTARRSPK